MSNSGIGGGETNLRVFNPATLFANGTKGKLFTGTYEGYEQTTRARKADGEEFLSRSHKFIDEEGNPVVVNATGQLDYLIKKNKIGKGDLVSVSYKGKEEAQIQGVKRKVHTFELEKLDDDI
jgi:hypothetical protein